MGSRFTYFLRSEAEKRLDTAKGMLPYNPANPAQLTEIIASFIATVPNFHDMQIRDLQYNCGKEVIAVAVSSNTPKSEVELLERIRLLEECTMPIGAIGPTAACFVSDNYYSEVFLNDIEMARRHRYGIYGRTQRTS